MAAPPSEISAPPHADLFGSAHPPPLPPAASSLPPPPPPRAPAPAPGVSRPARKPRGPKTAKKSKKPVVKPGKKPTKKPGRKPVVKLTGIIPRPPIPAPTLNAVGERVLVCPVPRHLCGLEQKNAYRPVDMERHLNSHFPPASGAKPHFCKGLPVEDFSEDLFKGLPEKLKEIRLGDDGDVAFVGGCGKRYARPDSLMRHARGCLSKKYCALVYLDDDDDGSA
ncbi:hypothetical protein TRAPUB_8793 [Trametes pubescens]|uniref:Uncharacterized protein n=1 Tax=Trametes pubescens TaxID=154538 RepID=A0A1M2W8B8_TRAPU|nr:hypothetical protein TRAPUB_8793 [Trametes pubescens]